MWSRLLLKLFALFVVDPLLRKFLTRLRRDDLPILTNGEAFFIFLDVVALIDCALSHLFSPLQSRGSQNDGPCLLQQAGPSGDRIAKASCREPCTRRTLVRLARLVV